MPPSGRSSKSSSSSSDPTEYSDWLSAKGKKGLVVSDGSLDKPLPGPFHLEVSPQRLLHLHSDLRPPGDAE